MLEKQGWLTSSCLWSIWIQLSYLIDVWRPLLLALWSTAIIMAIKWGPSRRTSWMMLLLLSLYLVIDSCFDCCSEKAIPTRLCIKFSGSSRTSTGQCCSLSITKQWSTMHLRIVLLLVISKRASRGSKLRIDSDSCWVICSNRCLSTVV